MSPLPWLFCSKVGIMVALEALVRGLRNGTHGAAAAQFDSRCNPSAEGHSADSHWCGCAHISQPGGNRVTREGMPWPDDSLIQQWTLLAPASRPWHQAEARRHRPHCHAALSPSASCGPHVPSPESPPLKTDTSPSPCPWLCF